MDNKDGSSQNVQELVNACLSHAQDLIRSAQLILDELKLPNIAYHLGVVALEEVGKASLIAVTHRATQMGKEPLRWSEKALEDHVRKLFWALWGITFAKESITRKQIESLQGVAKRVHGLRLRSLYVDPSEALASLPKDSVTEPEAQNLIRLTLARIDMEKSERPTELSEQSKEELGWLLRATEDSQKRDYIFGHESMEKRAELGSAPKWVSWLKQQFDKAEADGRALAEREFRRSEPVGEEAEEDKWKIRVRLYTNSHSIRPGTLGWWNRMSHRIKLLPVTNKKDQLLLDFVLPKKIPVQAVWGIGWDYAQKFVVALNIASMGFFWWYVPEHVSSFYEELWDLEAGTRMELKRQPQLRIDWGRYALSQQELINSAIFFSMIAKSDTEHEHRPFDHYLAGLKFLSKNDIHLQCEPNAYQQFFKALKGGMRLYQDWDGKEPFEDAFEKEIVTLVPDGEERKRILKLGQQLEKIPPIMEGVTLKEVGTLKILCDAYFTVKFRQQAKKDKTSEASGGAAE